MSYLTDEKIENKKKARRLLAELKEKEKHIKFHSRKIGKNTIVYCKNEERLNDFEKNYNNINAF